MLQRDRAFFLLEAVKAKGEPEWNSRTAGATERSSDSGALWIVSDSKGSAGANGSTAFFSSKFVNIETENP